MNYSAVLSFALAHGIGDVSLKRIIDYLQNNSDVSWEDVYADRTLLRSVLKLNDSTIDSLYHQKDNADRLTEQLYQQNISIVMENDKSYPQQLIKSLGNKCPPILFVQGNTNILNKKSIGFCGSRKVSQKGLSITYECAKQLVFKNVVVVSGYAAGTDLAAHKSALQNSGETIFVLAEGILRKTYKGEIKELLNSENHVFVSQFVPNLAWNAGNAMKRNRIIIGLTKAMILVESGKKGGTFAAGEETLSVHHPLFVIDFAQPEVSAEANPYFISKGGIPIRGKNGIPSLHNVFAVINRESSIQNQVALSPEQLKLNM